MVEAANARIKRWKYLDHILLISQIPFIGDFVRIVCAVSNKYLPPINGTKGRLISSKSYLVWIEYDSDHINVGRVHELLARALMLQLYYGTWAKPDILKPMLMV